MWREIGNFITTFICLGSFCFGVIACVMIVG